jgi:hypothetical protein
MMVNTLVIWTFKIGGILFLAGTCVVFIYGISFPFIEWWKKWRKECKRRELKSYTSWIKGSTMTTNSIEAIRIALNTQIDKGAINIKDVVSITYSPHAQGHQFTLWYRERPEAPNLTNRPKSNYYKLGY